MIIMKEKCKYKVTKRGSSSKSIMAYTPQDAIARLCQVSPVFIEQSDINNATYCVERLDSTRKSVRYYNIVSNAVTSKVNTTVSSKSNNEALESIRKCFNLSINNWYNEHIPEGDKEDPDYLYMDDYESDVNLKNPNTLVFYGHCTGHYDDYEDDDYDDEDLSRNFYFELDEMKSLLSACNIIVNKDVTLKKHEHDIIVTLKNITLEQFAVKFEIVH